MIGLASVPERNIQVELYRFLRNVIDKRFSFDEIEFVDVKFEQPSVDGRPDLVVYAREREREIPVLVIETKRKVPYVERRFDPFSKDVITQAERYATWLGAPYFATCNGEVLVIFETFKVGIPLPQRRMKDYKVPWPLDEAFAKALLEEVGKFRIGVGKWLPLDDIFVQRLRSFHRFITPFIHLALVEKLREDARFKEEYAGWLRSQLFEYSDEINEKIAEQIAYLLMNKITFYKTLETQMPYLPELKKIDAVDSAEFSEMLKRYFDRVLEVDYEGIFKKTILDNVQLPTKLLYPLNDFIEELGTYNLASIQSDILGRVYEELIPGGERHRLGQYYTPPPIVELIVEMCIKSPNDKVLDPGCGSGSFLVKAYHKLKDLKKKENPFKGDAELHKELLDQIYGIDINPFPAQLSSINLAVRNLKVRSENINLVVSDFFKVKPSMSPLPPEFDVVVTNPPYTRQEEMEYKEQIRDVALTYSDGYRIDIDARAGIYAYFFTHSAKFLKNGGRMGYITSDTWLDVGFGEGLKRFFLDHFKILAIIWYDVRAFEKPLVGTCIPIFEKEDASKKAREENFVKFVRIKNPMPTQEIVNVVQTTNSDFEDERIRVVLRRQRDLQPEEKWGKYLRAPAVYFKIISNSKITKLVNCAEVKFGIKTGAKEFFCFDKEKIRLWGVETEYLEPIVTSPKDVKIEIKPEDISQWVLMVHESKEDLLKKTSNVLKYIEWGENVETRIKGGTKGGTRVKGYHNISSVKSRKTWYDLGKKRPAPILRYRRIWERCIFSLNRANAQCSDTFNEIRPRSKDDIIVLAGILNSSVTALLSELQGRFYGGGVLELEIYECENLQVLDPVKLSAREREKIEQSFLKLCDAQRKGDKQSEEEAQRELDNAVFDALGLTENERKQVYEGLESLRQMRFQRKEVEVLVETAEKWMPPKKPERKRKIVEEEPTKRLDTWIR